MKFSHLPTYDVLHTRLVLCNTRVELKPSTFKFQRRYKCILIIICYILNIMKLFHLHVYKLCPLRLVLCSTRAKLKPSTFKISKKMQRNSNFGFFLAFNNHTHLHVYKFFFPFKTTLFHGI